MISVKLNHFSNILSMYNDCRILLPDEVKEDETLKVLWLCHGGSGDENEWLYYSTVATIPDSRHLAVVIVNANDSCFADMAYGLNYRTYLGKELPELLIQMFPHLSDKREDNYICGLSNGGYGCMLIGLSFPSRFGAIGAFSAGDKADSAYKPAEPGEITPRIRMFGADEFHNSSYSIRYLLQKVSAENKVKPRIYHACGSEDPWLDKNLLVRQTAEELNDPDFHYQYDQIEGLGHEWSFWEEELRRFLNYVQEEV